MVIHLPVDLTRLQFVSRRHPLGLRECSDARDARDESIAVSIEYYALVQYARSVSHFIYCPVVSFVTKREL